MAGARGGATAVTPPASYRADIDGLRALAVIPVCLFHAGVRGFGGGFVGVDVFFVISGFLMARMIATGLDDGTFTFAGFYERRARRILPALVVMMGATIGVAWLVAPPKLFTDTGAAAAGAAIFSANVVFWRGATHYFDAPAEWNPLLHTWSLSLEEQFYLIFPLLLWAIHRLAPRARGLAIVAAGALSFTICVIATTRTPTAAFYLLPARAWELLAGAGVAVMARSTTDRGGRGAGAGGSGDVVGIAGLALIVGPMAMFDRTIAFPGWAAVAPVLGTALLLARPGAAARLLSASPLVAIGRWSYSLYLWHWPVIVFGWKYGVFGEPTPSLAILLAAGTLVVSWASWRWIEQPVRLRRVWPARASLAMAVAAASIVLAGVGVAMAASDGRPARLPGFAAMAIDAELAADDADPAWRARPTAACFDVTPDTWTPERCRLGGSGPMALLWGDSFADKIGRGFAGEAAPFTMVEYTSPQCAPVVGHAPATRPACRAFTAAVPELISRHGITTVVMAANWSAHLGRRGLTARDIAASIATLHTAGARVVLIGQGPIFPFAYADEYRYRRARASRDDATLAAPARTYPEVNAALATTGADVFVDPTRIFCDGGDCRYRAGGHYLFMDFGHVTAAGARLVAGAIR